MDTVKEPNENISFPTVEDLKKDYKSTLTYQNSHVGKIKKWLENYYVEGGAKPKKKVGHSNIQPKVIRKQAEWRSASLSEPFLSTEKLFTLYPRTFEDKNSCFQNELLLNYQFNNQLNKIDFFDELVRKVVAEGTAIVKVGWDHVSTVVEVQEPVYEYFPIDPMDEENLMILEEASGIMNSNPKEFKKLLPEVQAAVLFSQQQQSPFVARPTGEFEIIPQTKNIVNQPSIEVVPTENVFIDPACQGNITKAKFIIQKYETTISDLKKKGIYNNLELLEGRVSSTSFGSLSDSEFITTTPSDYDIAGKNRKVLVVTDYWGYWDINNDGILKPIVATFIDDIMLRCEESPYPDGKPPFVVFRYLPIASSVYGEPDGELLEENQRIYGATMRALVNTLAKSANAQTLIPKQLFDEINKDRFYRGEDAEYQPSETMPVNALVQTMTAPELPSTVQFLLMQQINEAESITGVKAFSQGLDSSALGDVATSVKGVLDASAKRELSILRRIKQGVIELGRKVIAFNQNFLSDEEIIRITNESFVDISRDELQGSFDLIVDVTTPESEEAKASELSFMLQTLGNTVPFDITKKLLGEIAKLRKMPDLAKELAEYEPQPDPHEERMKELEIAEKMAKIEKEKAVAAYYSGQASNSELDFVNKAKGTDHQREVELREAQSKAQAETEKLKIAGDMYKESIKTKSEPRRGLNG